jgi:2-polyprenyl-6-methoxyphenol hydroxylase-like FAD-dependent oxidoreductase
MSVHQHGQKTKGSWKTGDVVVSQLQNTYTGEEDVIESSLVIGCDGANSRVRQAVGIECEAEESGLSLLMGRMIDS